MVDNLADRCTEPFKHCLDHMIAAKENTRFADVSGEIVEIYNRWFGIFGDPSPVTRIMYLLGTIPE